MSLFSATRQATGIFSKPQFLSLARSSPHRPYSTPRPPPNAPHNQQRSQFKILPIIAILALGSGSYVLLVKSRTGQPTRPN